MGWTTRCAAVIVAAMAVACATVEDHTPRPDTQQDLWPDPSWDPDAFDGPDAPDTILPEIDDDAAPDPIDDPWLDVDADPIEDPPADLTPDPDIVTDPPLDPPIDIIADPDVPADETPAGPGKTCATAIDLGGMTSWSGMLGDYDNVWSGGSGCGWASGREIWFTITVQDGYRLTLEDLASTDLVIQRVGSCGSTSCSWSSDEPERFEYFNDTGGSVSMIFVVEGYYASSTGQVQLSITNEIPDPGYDCTAPVDLSAVASWSGSYGDYGDLWSGGTGCMSAGGPEIWFTVTVRTSHRLIVEQTGSTDVVIHRLDSCVSTSCRWSSDEPEILDYYNDTGTDVTLILVVEKYYTGSSGTIQLQVSNAPPGAGYDCAAPIDLSSIATWTGSYADFSDLWSGGTGCMSASGPEIWFSATVHDGYRFTAEQTGATDVVMHRLGSCSATSCTWSTDEPELLDVYNDTGGDAGIILVVEKYYTGSSGAVQLSVSNALPPAGFACRSPVDATSMATWSGSYAGYGNLWTGGSGCRSASGREVWFTSTVAAGATFTLRNTSIVDVVIHRLASCAATACLWSSDSPESFSFTNSTGSPVTLYLIVEAYYATTTGTLSVAITNG